MSWPRIEHKYYLTFRLQVTLLCDPLNGENKDYWLQAYEQYPNRFIFGESQDKDLIRPCDLFLSHAFKRWINKRYEVDIPLSVSLCIVERYGFLPVVLIESPSYAFSAGLPRLPPLALEWKRHKKDEDILKRGKK